MHKDANIFLVKNFLYGVTRKIGEKMFGAAPILYLVEYYNRPADMVYIKVLMLFDICISIKAEKIVKEKNVRKHMILVIRH